MTRKNEMKLLKHKRYNLRPSYVVVVRGTPVVVAFQQEIVEG
jgi:hypothetical protein